MHEEVDYKRRFSVSMCRYIRRLDFDDFDASSPRPSMDHGCMERPSDYCWFMSFLSVWLEQINFEVRLRQVHTDSWARILLGWHNVEVLVGWWVAFPNGFSTMSAPMLLTGAPSLGIVSFSFRALLSSHNIAALLTTYATTPYCEQSL